MHTGTAHKHTRRCSCTRRTPQQVWRTAPVSWGSTAYRRASVQKTAHLRRSAVAEHQEFSTEQHHRATLWGTARGGAHGWFTSSSARPVGVPKGATVRGWQRSMLQGTAKAVSSLPVLVKPWASFLLFTSFCLPNRISLYRITFLSSTEAVSMPAGTVLGAVDHPLSH